MVNGTKIVTLEFNKHTNTSYITNIIDIDEYLETLNNETGKLFFSLAKKLAYKISIFNVLIPIYNQCRAKTRCPQGSGNEGWQAHQTGKNTQQLTNGTINAKQINKKTRTLYNVRQVYKGEIEEKLPSNHLGYSTERIITKRKIITIKNHVWFCKNTAFFPF